MLMQSQVSKFPAALCPESLTNKDCLSLPSLSVAWGHFETGHIAHLAYIVIFLPFQKVGTDSRENFNNFYCLLKTVLTVVCVDGRR
jgi:hypothetical protein